MRPIDELTALVPAPDVQRGSAGAIEGDGRALRLPPDYVELLGAYGAGTFDGVVAAFAPDGPRDGFDMLAMTRADAERWFMIEHEWSVEVPYARWPEEGALLQWGNAGGWGLYWKTAGSWPVVIVEETYEAYEELRLTATELVVAVLTGSTSLRGVRPRTRHEFTPAPGRLSASRDELIALVRRIKEYDFKTEREGDRALQEFCESVVHPRASNLIYWPSREVPGRDDLTAEEVVDIALAYKPIQLGPSSEA